MNERIVKLFMQSVDSNYIPLPIEDHMPSWTEKFAELIVRECAGIAETAKPFKSSDLILSQFGLSHVIQS